MRKEFLIKTGKMNFFVIEHKNTMVCLLCECVLKTFKKYNAKQHYNTHKGHRHVILEGSRRKNTIEKLKKN